MMVHLHKNPLQWILAIFFYLVPAFYIIAGVEDLKNGTVKITVQWSDGFTDTGTGIIISVKDRTVYLLTALHVVIGDEKRREEFYDWEKNSIQVEFYGFPATPLRGQLFKLDEENDLAVISIDDSAIQRMGLGIEFTLGNLSGVNPSYKILTIGNPGDEEWLDVNGRITRRSGNHFYFSANAVDRGNSGGPLVDRTRLVLMGLVTDITVSTGRDGRALSMDYIMGQLDKWRVPHQLRKGKMAKSMVGIPAGEFVMGSNGGESDEQPQRRVYLDEFWIDKYEVTVEEFRQFVVESGYQFKSSTIAGCNYNISGREKYPMNCISWKDAKAYADWAGKTLPTEAEWEKAARGPGGYRYPWGNEPVRRNDAAIEQEDTAPVGSHSRDKSVYGVMDMLGNVSEWVADWYNKYYYNTAPKNNPKGPETGYDRSIRGGSHKSRVTDVSLTERKKNISNAGEYYTNYGFRCVLRLQQ